MHGWVLGPANTSLVGGLLLAFGIAVVAILADGVGRVRARGLDELIIGTRGALLALGVDGLGTLGGLEGALWANSAWLAVFTEVARHRGGVISVEVTTSVELRNLDISPGNDLIVTVTFVALLVEAAGALDVLALAVLDWLAVAAESVLEEGAASVCVFVSGAFLACNACSNVRSFIAHLGQVHDLDVGVWVS